MSPSPLLGYNNNVRHRGKVFHIQTEDSGVKYGHIITHLLDGGRILKSVKTSYVEYLDNERLGDVVREMMKQQHKAMFISLREGKFDAFVEQIVDASPSLRPFVPEAPPKEPSPISGEVRPAAAAPPLPRTDRRGAPSLAGATPDAEPQRPPRRESIELTLDLEALGRATAAADVSSPALRGAEDLPPPPAQWLRDKTVTPKPPGSALPPSARRPSSISIASERRYAPTRPASIFGQSRPQQGKSIFGEDVMNDKSLDEVILSYLADDLDAESK